MFKKALKKLKLNLVNTQKIKSTFEISKLYTLIKIGSKRIDNTKSICFFHYVLYLPEARASWRTLVEKPKIENWGSSAFSIPTTASFIQYITTSSTVYPSVIKKNYGVFVLKKLFLKYKV